MPQRFSAATSTVALGKLNPLRPRVNQHLHHAAQALVDAYRRSGFAYAKTNPLGSHAMPSSTELSPMQYGLALGNSLADGDTDFSIGEQIDSVAALVSNLQKVYCGAIGADCAHVRNQAARKWMWRTMEALVSGAPWPGQDRIERLERLIAAETWEQYLNENYPATKRFSLEGCESLIPLLDQIARCAVGSGIEAIHLGMPHRGRVNVLVNLMGVPVDKMEALLEGRQSSNSGEWDLKYHLGASATIETPDGPIPVFLAHNPSHLESVAPVLLGMTRAVQDDNTDRSGKSALAVILHGDAAFAGQGIVMESLNLSATRGFRVGGAVHVVINNQVGFTTSNPQDARSSAYCTDIARMIDAPVLHVNADSPDHVALAAAIAIDYRNEFGSDVVIDLIGYRRLGHNEQDIAAITQPAMYEQIKGHPTVVTLFEQDLLRDGLIDEQFATDARARYLGRITLSASKDLPAQNGTSCTTVAPLSSHWGLPVDTRVPHGQLRQLVESLTRVPRDFRLHREVAHTIDGWQRCIENVHNRVDWTLAENLAYASLVANGYSIRLSGMDVGRGTFCHRHAVWHNQERTEHPASQTFIPLRHIGAGQGEFDIYDSPLAEEAVVGFEYGYSVMTSRDLVIWEAQYGDFVNNAQVIIDQYISTGEAKWGYKSRLTVLLPHGHEGWGPEHSNGYLGRFLQLCAENNLRVVMPSTSAQWFHLLRRQALVDESKPLIAFTPKTFLHGDLASHSPLGDFTTAEFHAVLDANELPASKVRRILLCSGKVYFDLQREAQRGDGTTAIVRLEQFHPFPGEALSATFATYRNAIDIVWVQEEHLNHGAWHFIRDELEQVLRGGARLRCVSRPPAAPSATCGQREHERQQSALVEAAYRAE